MPDPQSADSRPRIDFSPHIFRLQSHGGISRYVTELHKAFLRLGTDSRILAGLHRSDALAGVPRVVGVRLPPLLQLRMPRLTSKVSKASADLLAALSHPNVYHLSYYSRDSRRRTGFLAVTVYDMIHERFPGEFPQADQTGGQKRDACRQADIIFAVSECTRDDLLTILSVDPDKVVVTPLAPSGLQLPEGSDVALQTRRPYILFVGSRLASYKNFLPLVRGLQSAGVFDEFDLVCFGGGSFTATEAQMLSSLSVRSKVRSVQGPDSLLALHYRSASAYVCPSLYEGFGLPVLEAMSLSCPVACSNTSALPEVAGTAAVYFDPNNEDDIGLVTRSILEDTKLRATIISQAGPRVQLFSWEQTALATLAGYRKVIL